MENKVFCLWGLSSLCTQPRVRRLVFLLELLYLCPPTFAIGGSLGRSHRAIEYDDTCSTDCSQTDQETSVLYLYSSFFAFGESSRQSQRSVIKYEYDETCPKDCSQSSPRFFGDTVFDCTVGNLAEVKKFREKYGKAMNSTEFRFDPPKLLGVDFFHKRFKDGTTEGALNITFQLPKRSINGYWEVEYPIAVFLQFQSVENPKFQDFFYYKNPRERIFQFRNYRPKTLYNRANPVKISYDCLVGLDDSKPTTAYTINLATAFGLNVTYYFTVYAQQGSDVGYPTRWLPTIATYYNTSARYLHVVFGESDLALAPEMLVYYNISLILSDGTVVDHKKIYAGRHETVFTNLKRGSYFVKVSKCEKNAYELMYVDQNTVPRCISATSYAIFATTEGSPEILSNEEGLTLPLALTVSLGCLIEVAFVALMIMVYRKKCAGEKPAGCTRRTEPRNHCTVPHSTERKTEYGPALRMEKRSLVYSSNATPRKMISDKPGEPKLLKLEQDRQYADPNSTISSEAQSAPLMEDSQNTQKDANKQSHSSYSKMCDGLGSNSELRSFRSYMDIFAKINDSRCTIDTLSSGSDEQAESKSSLKSFRSYMAIFARINDSVSSSYSLSFASDKLTDSRESNDNFEKEKSNRRISL